MFVTTPRVLASDNDIMYNFNYLRRNTRFYGATIHMEIEKIHM